MNLVPAFSSILVWGIPRVSGDEPMNQTEFGKHLGYSPRERG